MNFLLISDYSYEEVNGGAESNDKVLLEELKKTCSCSFLSSLNFNANFEEIKDIDLYIVSNFYFLSERAKHFLKTKRYVIIEHDYKFLATRNPFLYERFVIPESQILNKDFYISASLVVLQSQLQAEIFYSFIAFPKYMVFNANLWDQKALSLMLDLCKKPKNGKSCVLASNNPIKGQVKSEEYCKLNNLIYDVIPAMDYYDFLNKLSSYSNLVFIPSSPETFSRVCLEAKMMGVNVIAPKCNIGALETPYFNESPENIIELMTLKKLELVRKIKDLAKNV